MTSLDLGLRVNGKRLNSDPSPSILSFIPAYVNCPNLSDKYVYQTWTETNELRHVCLKPIAPIFNFFVDILDLCESNLVHFPQSWSKSMQILILYFDFLVHKRDDRYRGFLVLCDIVNFLYVWSKSNDNGDFSLGYKWYSERLRAEWTNLIESKCSKKTNYLVPYMSGTDPKITLLENLQTNTCKRGFVFELNTILENSTWMNPIYVEMNYSADSWVSEWIQRLQTYNFKHLAHVLLRSNHSEWETRATQLFQQESILFQKLTLDHLTTALGVLKLTGLKKLAFNFHVSFFQLYVWLQCT